MAQLLHPTSDGTPFSPHTTWTTPIWSKLDEVVADDTDYTDKAGEIGVAAGATNSFRSLVTTAQTPASPTSVNCLLHVRVQRYSTVGTQSQLYFLVRRGSTNAYIDGPTLVEINTANIPIDGNFHQYDIGLDTPSSYTSADWADLSIEFREIAPGGGDTDGLRVSWLEVEIPDPATQWWKHPTYGWYRKQAGNPSLDVQPTDPAPSSLGWLWDTWTTTTAPTGSGWWFSDSDYGGAATLIASGRPAQPRLYTEINAFATGSTAMLGGSPGAGCVFNNHLVYAKGGYTVGTDYPTIRVWDGTFDRQLAIVPPTSAGAVPKAIMSFLAANGTIYVSTLDSGTDSTTYTGRVFELDFESGVLSQVGAVFPTGHVPYSLAWYNGQLFCGTHRRTPTAAGRIYKFRTDFTTSTWVLDRDLTSDSVGGVTSMLSFQGTLFVGTDADAATFAKILARDYAGTYTTSDTGSGGTAVANNGFLSMVEFSSNLYVGYWNNDVTAITKIRKYNGSAWSTAYTGAAGTLRPLIGFVVDDGFIFAIGGGLSLSAIVLRSTDGASWTDLTAQVTSASSFTAVPVFGVIVL